MGRINEDFHWVGILEVERDRLMIKARGAARTGAESRKNHDGMLSKPVSGYASSDHDIERLGILKYTDCVTNQIRAIYNMAFFSVVLYSRQTATGVWRHVHRVASRMIIIIFD